MVKKVAARGSLAISSASRPSQCRRIVPDDWLDGQLLADAMSAFRMEKRSTKCDDRQLGDLHAQAGTH